MGRLKLSFFAMILRSKKAFCPPCIIIILRTGNFFTFSIVLISLNPDQGQQYDPTPHSQNQMGGHQQDWICTNDRRKATSISISFTYNEKGNKGKFEKKNHKFGGMNKD